ncbi:MAG: putative membrane-bound dehydrogenase-like protein [Rhodothermales bacterium]|jgi:putative membrane-bound dehydrogenase-like protein
MRAFFLLLLALPCFAAPHILILIGEHEYGTAETLPAFVESELGDYACTIIRAKSNDRKSRDCHVFPGLAEALKKADLLLISVRRRYPPKSAMAALREWIDAGHPVVGIRTSSHAFGERPKGSGYQAPAGHEAWNSFDRDVFGASYQGHFGSQHGKPAARLREVRPHPILDGIQPPADWQVSSHLYRSRLLAPSATVLWSGEAFSDPGSDEPIAWTYGRNVHSSLGSISDMAQPWFRRFLANAIAWSLAQPKPAAPAKREKVANAAPQAPADSLATLHTHPDLELSLIASEPVVAQPNFITFDPRGRMWVSQYRQYPFPAGVTLRAKDKYWRASYEKLPAPPGHPDFVPGLDRLTIHSGASVTTFLDQQNLITGCAFAPDGVWVLNPPYLLFYADNNHDDKPDGPPTVHLSGFGIEDTHSVVNSLCWGPDGWLYAAQGSTVSAAVTVSGSDASPIHSRGQHIWRYHPSRRIYEIFAEGGGNIWSCEFDSQGRLLAGTNEGNKVGYHYLQGAYHKKTFGKHGQLSNPYALGYFPGIPTARLPRVTTNILAYDADALPSRYRGGLFACNPLTSRVNALRVGIDGPHVTASKLDLPIDSDDGWFRPVYAEQGPDGAIYIADWYDRQVNHRLAHEGRVSPADGRIYRISGKQPQTLVPDNLIARLSHPNRWQRDTARRLLAAKPETTPALRKILAREHGQLALEAFWTLNLQGQAKLPAACEHRNPHVRLWAARFLGDLRTPHPVLAKVAATEKHPEVRAQLAASTRRLPAEFAIPIIRALLKGENNPLMIWWAIEAHAAEHPEAVAGLPLTPDLAEKLAHRLAGEGKRRHQRALATLFKNGELRKPLLTGFEAAYRGRAISGLHPELAAAVGQGSLATRLRTGDPAALAEALARLADPKILAIFAELPSAAATQPLIALLGHKDPAIVQGALAALQPLADSAIPDAILAQLPKYNPELRRAAIATLKTRPAWAAMLPSEPTVVADSADIPAILAGGQGDPYAGKPLVEARCLSCHTLFAKGGAIGPDLTGYQRHDLASLLFAIEQPSAEIREGYEHHIIETTDGRTLSGFITERDDTVTILRPLGGADIVLRTQQIAKDSPSPNSLMPAKLLAGLTPQQTRDFFAYLRSSQPLNLR